MNSPKVKNKTIIFQLFRLIVPSCLGSLLAFSTQAITVSFVGRRLGPQNMAYFSIAISIYNLFGLSIGVGLVSALDTLVSQSFGRYKQTSKEIGEYLQRSNLINIFVLIPIALFFILGQPLLSFIFGEELGRQAAKYLPFTIPCLYIQWMINTLTKTLQAVNEPKLPMIASGVSVIASFLFNYYLLYGSYLNAALVLTLVQCTMLIVLVLLCIISPKVTFYQYCSWPSTDLLDSNGVREYFSIGIPALISCVAEWWAFEALQIIAAQVSIETVVLLNMATSSSNVMFSIALGVGIASSVSVGNALGENNPSLARRSAIVAIFLDLIIATTTVISVLVLRYKVAAVYTNDAFYQEKFATAGVFVLGAAHFCDSIQFVIQGVFRGAGMQKQSVKAVLISLWAVGIPSSLILGKFLTFGAMGIQGGIVIGMLLEIPALLIYFKRWDWDQLAKLASRNSHFVHMTEDVRIQVDLEEIADEEKYIDNNKNT